MEHRPLFILADLESGGAQRVILNVLRHLNRQSFEPHLALVDEKGPMAGEIPEEVISMACRRHWALKGEPILSKKFWAEVAVRD